MYLIQNEKSEQTKGRFSMLRNVWEVEYREPYAKYYLMFEFGSDETIEINKKLRVSYYSENVESIVKANGFSSVQEFTDAHRKDFHGFYSLINQTHEKR